MECQIFGKSISGKTKAFTIITIIIVLSVLIFAGCTAKNEGQDDSSTISINGTQLTEEQLNTIDEAHILQDIIRNKFLENRFSEFDFEKSNLQLDKFPNGTVYFSNSYPICNGMQVDYISLIADAETVYSYDIYYYGSSLNNPNFQKMIKTYTNLLGDSFKETDSLGEPLSDVQNTLSFEEITSIPYPENDSELYYELDSCTNNMETRLTLSIDSDGVARLKVFYTF